MMKGRGEKVITFLYHAGNWVVRIVGSLIFLLLTWYSFRYTYYMEPGGAEIPRNMKDSELWNFLGLAVTFTVFVLLMLFEKYTDSRAHLILQRISLTATMLWVGSASFWWIFSADRVPEGDQAFIYGGASYFIEGNYAFLSGQSAYCGMYPYQLGLIALVELLFRVVGAYNYYVYEYLCAILAVGIVYLGYRVVSGLTDRMATVVGYNLLMMGCLPLIFYTPWVYGDIPSIFCALLAAWMLLAYCKKGKKRYLVVLVVALVLSMLFRKHSLLLMVALGIAAVLYTMKRKDWKIIIAVMLAAVCSYGTYQGIYKMYEIRSGYEHYNGIPIVAWMAMGLQETNGCYGWYNNYPKEVHWEQNFDSGLTALAAMENLQDRLQYFKENPDYAEVFLREKVLSQWNGPLYQSIYFNTKYKEGLEPEEGSLAFRVGKELYYKVLAVSDRWHFIIFFGMLCYFSFAVKKDSNILHHVLVITIIGGFLFSIIHEAKGRYIFPYYVIMFPFSVYGLEQVLIGIMRLVSMGWQRKSRKPAGIE